MSAYVRRPAFAGCLALALTALSAGPVAGQNLSMRLNGYTNAPVGYVEFCKRLPSECSVRGEGSAEMLTAARWKELYEINRAVNRVVTPATDLDFYRSEEVWALPDTSGDCED